MEKNKKSVTKTEPTYIITGMTGHLGNVIVRYLLGRGKKVAGFLLPGEKNPFPGVSAVYGDITDKESLRPLFLSASERIVIHCAGQVSISSFDGLNLWNTNVNGTRNMVDLAVEYGVEKFIYVSSVHAIPEQPGGYTQRAYRNTCPFGTGELRSPRYMITEIKEFCPEDVVGDYAKTKSNATKYVLEAAGNGLAACVVHPSGIIGPYDQGRGQMSSVLQMYLRKRLPAGVTGGYDFVDVRDVAEGILSCCEKGRDGECYILSGHYYSVKEFLELAAKEISRKPPGWYVPLEFAEPAAALWEKALYKLGKKTVFTPYALYTLGSNGNFSHAKATEELGYTVRNREQTVRDMVRWTVGKMRRKF